MAPFDGTVLTLRERKARPLWFGHPWVWAGAIASISQEPAPGDLVEVRDASGAIIDYALFSPGPVIRARTLGVGRTWPEGWPSRSLPPEFWSARLERALARRAGSGLPSPDATAWRAINGEGDELPGFFLDLFDRVAVLRITTAAAARHVPALLDALLPRIEFEAILLRPDRAAAELEGFSPAPATLAGTWPEAEASPRVRVVDRGVHMWVEPGASQKTGHYIDQRENRAWFGRLARGRRAFDGFCFTGGFALHAARGGASEVVAVDTSEAAIAMARENAALNGFAAPISWFAGRVEDHLRRAADRREPFGLISLDPPPLAHERDSAERATRKVESLVSDAVRALSPDGLLLLSSCSAAIGSDLLCQAVSAACARVGRRPAVLGQSGQPEDHPYPAPMPEGRYLSSVLFAVA